MGRITSICLVLFLVLIFKSGAYAQMDTVLYDCFDDNRNDWLLSNTENSYTNIADGRFVLNRKTKGNLRRTQFVFFNRDADFSVEVKFSVDSPGEYGIMWGMDNDDNNYNFTIRRNKFSMYNYLEGKLVITKDFSPCEAIREGGNTLKVVRETDRVHYYINNTQVWEEAYRKMPGRRFGMTLWNSTKVNAEYLLIMGKKVPINLNHEAVYMSEPENLGPSINSKYDDLLDAISPDGATLYISRVYSPTNTGGVDDYSDIYYSRLVAEKWTPVVNIRNPLNDADPNSVCSVSPDGNSLLLLNSYDGASTGVSTTYWTGKEWDAPVSLAIKNYYNKAEENEFYLANDNKTLLMTLQRDDTHGKKDVYVSFKQGESGFSEPLNLGPIVNTEEIETSPFLASDGVTLYYSTEGFSGYGSSDIFVTRRLDDTWTNWSVPQNIGKPVNTASWDAYYTIPASGDYAYFVSYQNSFGEGDVFRIKLPEKVKPNPVVLITGKVLNSKTRQAVNATIRYEILPSGNEAGMARTDPSTGEYKIVLPYGKNYGFSAGAKGFIPVSENLDLTNVAEYKVINRDLLLVPIEIGETVRLNNIFFDFGKSILRTESFPELDRIVALMNQSTGLEIELSGHTDNVGSDNVNLKLSEDRAKAVQSYIVSKGILESRINAKGYGKTKPVAGNDTEEGKQMNRRVEFTIIKI